MCIETKRLVLRKFEETDLMTIHQLFSNQKLMHDLAMSPPSDTIEDSKEYLNEWMEDRDRYAITLKENHQLIGYIVFHPDSEDHREDTRELGYALLPEYRGKGYMKETLTACLDYLYNHHIYYAWACCLHDNMASKSLIERMNFEYIKDGEVEIEEDCFYPTYEYRITLKHKTKFANLLVRIKEICYNIAGKKG